MPESQSSVRRRLLLPEVAERLRVPPRTVRTWLATGELRGIEVSTKRGNWRPRYVVDEADLEDFERRRATMPAPPPRKTRRTPAENPPILVLQAGNPTRLQRRAMVLRASPNQAVILRCVRRCAAL